MFEEIICSAERLEGVRRARLEWRLKHVEDSAARDDREIARLGRHLLFDPRGPALIYSTPRFSRTDAQETVVDPMNDPAALIEKIEATAAGCRWLLEQWGELRANLEPGNIRGFSDNFRIIRLMGKRPVDALEEPEAAEVYLASHALEGRERNAFTELRNELRVDEIKQRLLRMRKTAESIFIPLGKPEARERLIGIIERAEARLQAKIEDHRRSGQEAAVQAAAARAFDQTPLAKSLARWEVEYAKSISRGIATLRKFRRNVYSDQK